MAVQPDTTTTKYARRDGYDTALFACAKQEADESTRFIEIHTNNKAKVD
jgi:hypothetical protein